MTAPAPITPEAIAKAIHALMDERDYYRSEVERLQRQQSDSNKKKLTDREVKRLKEMHRAGTSQAELAEVFDIHPATVSRIVRGLYWR